MSTTTKTQSRRVRELCRQVRGELSKARAVIHDQMTQVRRIERTAFTRATEAEVIGDLERTLAGLRGKVIE